MYMREKKKINFVGLRFQRREREREREEVSCMCVCVRERNP